MNSRHVTVSAAANIALVKYWGKSPRGGNQPATGSLSIGLEDLRTTTSLAVSDTATDQVRGLDDRGAARVVSFLDTLRDRFGLSQRFSIETGNNFPTGSGLASSASGFAALAIGLNELLALGLGSQALSRVARLGSGSAARSIHGGFVEVIADDDAWAKPVAAADSWPLDVVVAITSEASKQVGSTEAMQRTAATSPYYTAWVESHAGDMDGARRAIASRDFTALASVSEHNCLKMHGAIMTSRPPVLYWLPATLAVMHAVSRMREGGLDAFFSIDAGPQVKVICAPADSRAVADELAGIPGVLRVISTRVGGAPEIESASP